MANESIAERVQELAERVAIDNGLELVHAEVAGPENKPKNKYAYPGFNIGGPLMIPGTSFNKDRNKVFFFTGYEFYKQRLDTGILQSWVPTDGSPSVRPRR